MIREIYEDLFNLRVDALAHGCNTKGIMGDGIARQFKVRYPQMFIEYASYCSAGLFNPGDVHFYKSGNDQPHVVNVATQTTPGGGARSDYIERGLVAVREMYKRWGIKSLAIPKIGCGLGGLEWDEVNKIVEKIFGSSDLEVVIALGEFADH